jgi:hypothetical protein
VEAKIVPDQESIYQAFLLRLWRDGVDQPWRASLLLVGREEARHFAGVDGLLAFVQEQTRPPVGADALKGGDAQDD